MMRLTCFVAAGLAAGLIGIDGTGLSAATDPHAYFNALVGQPYSWKAFSLRDPAQLQTKANGGYSSCNSCPLDVEYDAAADAARVTIPITTNSLRNQLRLPMGTEDGRSYFITWEALYTNSYLPSVTQLVNHKAYQFGADRSTQVFEVRTRFDGGNLQSGASGPLPGFNPAADISAVDARSYFAAPGTTKLQPMLPQAGSYILKPNRWVRFFVRVDQTTSTDFFSLWVADNVTGLVQIQNRGAVLIPAGGLTEFWVELNTSTDAVAPGRGPLVSYVRNVAMLRDVVDTTSLLLTPAAGIPLPPTYTPPPPPTATPPPSPSPSVPSAPRNLRIVPGV